MYSLVLKDILTLKSPLLLSFGYSIFFFLTFGMKGSLPSSTVYILILVVLTQMFIQNSCYGDVKNKSQIIINSLPITRTSVVISKYLSTIVFFLFNLVVVAIVGVLFNLTYPDKFTTIGLPEMAFALVFSSLGASIYLPIFFKYGYLKSRMLHTLLSLAFFFGPLTLLSYVNNNPDNTMVIRLMTFLSNSSNWILGMLLSIVVIIINITSLTLSSSFYHRREF